MSITAYAQTPSTGVRLTLASPREAHEARAQQACCDAIDAAVDATADANRNIAGAPGGTIPDAPTFAEAWQARPGALDRFAPVADRSAD